MKNQLARSIAILLLGLFAAQSSFATCGGGGGGGGGGMSNGGGGGGGNAPVYVVPWKVHTPKDAPAKGLVLYWFPASENEWKNSSLHQSRTLSLYASQCVNMEVGTNQTPNAMKIIGDSKLPVAVLATPEGTTVSKLDSKDGKLKVAEVEKLVDTEMKKRENGVTEQMNEAGRKVKAGDNDGAIKLYRAVLDQKCLFPKKVSLKLPACRQRRCLSRNRAR